MQPGRIIATINIGKKAGMSALALKVRGVERRFIAQRPESEANGFDAGLGTAVTQE
jgi:hypothetical protein